MLKTHLEETHQVSQFATLLAVAMDSGLSLIGALHETFGSAKGSVASKFQRLLAALDLGGNVFDELATLRSNAGSRAVSDLVIKLQVSLQFGSPLTDQLMQFSQSLRSELAQKQLTASTKKENLMLLPLVFLILPVTVLFAVFPAVQYLNIPIER
jgi:tight adherence protein C